MKSQFIRFVKQKKHLIDDLDNGFILREHDISFRTSLSNILPPLINFWENSRIVDPIVVEVRTQFRALSENDFWLWLGDRMKQDFSFNIQLCIYTTQLRNARIKMKCFTELRDNQKLHPHHQTYFGTYGISLKYDWLIKNRGDRIIYVSKDSEVTNRIAQLTSMLLSSGLSREDSMKAMFDILSFTEVGDHSHEYEWRIVGNHNFAGKSYGNYPDLIPFLCGDIMNIYVERIDEISELEAILQKKADKEKTKDVPKVKLTESIFLTTEEAQEIESIYSRRSI